MKIYVVRDHYQIVMRYPASAPDAAGDAAIKALEMNARCCSAIDRYWVEMVDGAAPPVRIA